MAICVGCTHDVDNQGELQLNHSCAMNGLLTCVEGIRNDPSGQGMGLGYAQQWPKRFSTLLLPRGAAGDNEGDGRTFLGSPTQLVADGGNPRFDGEQRSTGAQSAANPIPCPATTPGFDDDVNNVELDGGDAANPPHRNGLIFCNDFDIPVMVQVEAFAWKMDVTYPQTANGGVRWLGEVRIDIEDCASDLDNPTVLESLDWQRGAEMSRIVQQNGDYNSDPRGIQQAMRDYGNSVQDSLTALADCLGGTFAQQVGAAGGDGAALAACVNQARARINQIGQLGANAGFNILTADNPWPSNPAYVNREVRTEGDWGQTVLLLPGQRIRTQTRARFARWDRDINNATITPNRTFSFCNASGQARPGQITYDVMPVAGGTECDDDVRYLGAFESNVGGENQARNHFQRPDAASDRGLVGN